VDLLNIVTGLGAMSAIWLAGWLVLMTIALVRAWRRQSRMKLIRQSVVQEDIVYRACAHVKRRQAPFGFTVVPGGPKGCLDFVVTTQSLQITLPAPYFGKMSGGEWYLTLTHTEMYRKKIRFRITIHDCIVLRNHEHGENTELAIYIPGATPAVWDILFQHGVTPTSPPPGES
jgi:hypothetical protein